MKGRNINNNNKDCSFKGKGVQDRVDALASKKSTEGVQGEAC